MESSKKDDSRLALLVAENIREFGELVDRHLVEMYNKTSETYIVPMVQPNFSNGEGKTLIKETVREKNAFILADVANPECSYNYYGRTNYLSPKDHYAGIKSIISACSGNTSRINLIWPYLYAARQDKRNGRESLECAVALQELEKLGVKAFVMYDVHNPGVQNAIPNTSFENIYATALMLQEFGIKEDANFKKMTAISPDFGASGRTNVYADMLSDPENNFMCDFGVFFKRRDYSKMINGKHPIIEHQFLGGNLEGRTAIVVDDMISSGDSLFETIDEIKKRGAKQVFIFVTFALFVNGIEMFNDYYKRGMFDRIYTTNVSHISKEALAQPWLSRVDCSSMTAEVIGNIYEGKPLSHVLNGKTESFQKIKKYINERGQQV